MRTFSPVERSWTCNTSRAPLLRFLIPPQPTYRTLYHGAAPRKRDRTHEHCSVQTIEKCFLSALTKAGSCQFHPAHAQTRQNSSTSSPKRTPRDRGQDWVEEEKLLEAAEAAAGLWPRKGPQENPRSAEEHGVKDDEPEIGGAASDAPAALTEQMEHLKAVRDLEQQLKKARHKLHVAMKKDKERDEQVDAIDKKPGLQQSPVALREEDLMGLVDLYFYSHRTRFLSEEPDASPTPLQLEDYSIIVSGDFSPPTQVPIMGFDHEGDPISPLYDVETEFRNRKSQEVTTLQVLVDLLMDDCSSLGDLYQAYQALPQPGVSQLSPGIIRLLLQRMSTPHKPSKTAWLRYSSLLDDMQVARLPITAWEWSSAIYLAGKSISTSPAANVSAALDMWRKMEQEAGVPARAVTFNILFDLAVKAGKFVLAESMLKEMHVRGFRLNRLGRVSLIYYYGKLGDGDAVRKAYRDFVKAGEIVDTLVLNCVMASLISAQEPVGAEQIYERMKAMQEQLQRGWQPDEDEPPYRRYPLPPSGVLDQELASNSLGRVLLRASQLKGVLPEHHMELQRSMPLTPDAITFRNLISYHATDGNINRLTVLLDDMTRHFRIPLTPLIFQLLFKGFAMHGGSTSSEAQWTTPRLNVVWEACLACMKEQRSSGRKDLQPNALELPTVKEAGGSKQPAPRPGEPRQKPARKPTVWKAFISQLSGTDLGPETAPSFDLYPSSRNSLVAPAPDAEDDVYRLPKVGLTTSTSPAPTPLRPTKHMIIWAIRAFTRCTSSRKVLEDVWFQAGKVWRPADQNERNAVVSEFRRALKYCDVHGEGG